MHSFRFEKFSFIKIEMTYRWHARILLNPLITDSPTLDQATTDHLPTNKQIHRPPTHRSTNPDFTNSLTRSSFKDFLIKKYLFCRIQTQLGKYKAIFDLFDTLSS